MKKLFILYILFTNCLFAQAQKNMDTDFVPCRIIYKIDVNVRSKRPDKNISPPLWKYALLNICRPENEKIIPQRQVIGVEWKHKTLWKEMVDVEKVFETEEEAFRYAHLNMIPIASDTNNTNKISYMIDPAVKFDPNGNLYTGTARNAKTGACLVTEDGQTYFVENLEEWSDRFLNKTISINGVLITRKQNEPLKNEKGEYSGGMEGSYSVITKPVLPDNCYGISSIVVFKKETPEKKAEEFMESTGYPFSEGMDSSRGKAYFYKTGNKYFILFPSEKTQLGFLKKYSEHELVYEIYKPDWKIQKD
jgi:hypothetical protein